MPTLDNIRPTWQQFIGALGIVFIAGGVFAKFELQHKEIEQLQAELEQTKEQLYKEIEQRVDDLEEWREYIKGINESVNKKQ